VYSSSCNSCTIYNACNGTTPCVVTLPAYSNCASTNTTVSLSLTPVSTNVTCGSTVEIDAQVTGLSSNGLYGSAAGLPISYSTSLGSVQPIANSGNAMLSLPLGSQGTATVSANYNGTTAQTLVNVSCQQSTVPAVQQPVYVPPVAAPLTILPPNTGDAGLAAQSSNGISTTLLGVFALAGLSLLGIAGAIKVRSRI
jgi:hypothetical protein